MQSDKTKKFKCDHIDTLLSRPWIKTENRWTPDFKKKADLFEQKLANYDNYIANKKAAKERAEKQQKAHAFAMNDFNSSDWKTANLKDARA